MEGVLKNFSGGKDDAVGDISCLVHGSLDSEGPLVLKFPGNAGRAERSGSFPLAALSGGSVEGGLAAEIALNHHLRGNDPPANDPRDGHSRECNFQEPAGSVWTWNPPGYGDSEGPARLSTYATSAVAFADRVWEHVDAPERRVFLCGNSMGCCAALYIAAKWRHRDRIAGLILRNPPPLDLVVMRIASRYPMGGFMKPVAQSLCPSMNAIKTIAGVEAPILWIACEDDSLVPLELQSRIFENHPGHSVRVLLEGLDHNDLPDAVQVQQIHSAIQTMDWRL